MAQALEVYEAGLAIRVRLAESDPSNTEWQRDLYVSYNNLGDIHAAQGDLAKALEVYRAGLTINSRLAESDPSNAQWQRGLMVSHIKFANISEDYSYYRTALSIAKDMQNRGILAPSDKQLIAALTVMLDDK